MAARLKVNVFVVSNNSRPIRPPGTANVRMVLVGDTADAADDWIADHITAADDSFPTAQVAGDLTTSEHCRYSRASKVFRSGDDPRADFEAA